MLIAAAPATARRGSAAAAHVVQGAAAVGLHSDQKSEAWLRLEVFHEGMPLVEQLIRLKHGHVQIVEHNTGESGGSTL